MKYAAPPRSEAQYEGRERQGAQLSDGWKELVDDAEGVAEA